MTLEKWQGIVGNIKDSFSVEDQGSQHLEEEGGVDVEYIIFKSPLGKIRLELVIKPVILDKKTTYSTRIGSETKIDYIYSETEKNYQMMAYKWDDSQDDWQEISADGISNL